MKKIVVTGLLCTLLFISNFSSAQSFNAIDEIPHDIAYFRESNVTLPLVKVVYGRPSKTSEKVFGSQVAFNEIWRTGANEATEVKFFKDVQFGDQEIKAGTYVLYTIPNESEWEVILNSNLDVLGAFQYNALFDVAKIKVPVTKAEDLEVFSIGFKEKDDKLEMVLAWDTTRVKVPLQFKNRSQLAKL